MSSVIIAHTSSSLNARRLASALERHGLLTRYVTALAIPEWLIRNRLLPRQIRLDLSRRFVPGVSSDRILHTPVQELINILVNRLQIRKFPGYRDIYEMNHVVSALAGRACRTLNPKVAYGYEDAALELFHAAVEVGAKRLLELPLGYWRRVRQILLEDADYAPEWQECSGIASYTDAQSERKEAEIELAEGFVVPCSFAADTLGGRAGGRPVYVVPYGCPRPSRHVLEPRRKGEPLRILYAGTLSQRKGLAYLFAAVRMLGVPYELVLAGPAPYRATVIERELADPRHRWIGPLRHDELLRLMHRMHVFVFPSLAEGFGLVITEAMSQGLPVIASTHTCAPDIVDHGRDGFVVPIRDPSTIATILEELYQDDERRLSIGEAARQKMKELGWEAYERVMLSVVLTFMDDVPRVSPVTLGSAAEQ